MRVWRESLGPCWRARPQYVAPRSDIVGLLIQVLFQLRSVVPVVIEAKFPKPWRPQIYAALLTNITGRQTVLPISFALHGAVAVERHSSW